MNAQTPKEEVAEAQKTGEHFCLSTDAGCSGIRPCPACRQFLRGVVLPTAMEMAGGQLIASREHALSFIVAWEEALTLRFQDLLDQQRMAEAAFADSLHEQETHGMGASEEGVALKSADALRAMLLDMDPDELEEIAEMMKAGTLPDQNNLTPEEREVFDSVLKEVLGVEKEEPATAPTEPPLTPKAEEVATKQPEPNRSPDAGDANEAVNNEDAQDASDNKE